MLFIATTVNYLDRQVLSLTWKDFIAPEFHWTDSDYGSITAVFSIVYAVANLFAGKFMDWIGTRRGYTVAIGVWSVGACLHALCGWATEHSLGLQNVGQMLSATGAITMLSIYGGKLPTIIMNRTGLNPYASRMMAMFIFALIPLLAIVAQPLGSISY